MLSIVIPTYKEAQNIDVLLPRIYQVIMPQYPGSKIIVVDDNSQDGIEDVVARHNKICGGVIQLLVRKDKRGLASAWKDGMRAATTAWIGIMDADLAHSPEDVLRMADALKNGDMVIGSRYLPGQLVRMKSKSFFAIYLSALGQRLCRWLLGIKVYDMSHSLRVFEREVFAKAEPFLECEGNAMMVEFTFHTARLNFKIQEIPIAYGERLYGETKLGIMREGSKFLKILLNLRRRYPKNAPA